MLEGGDPALPQPIGEAARHGVCGFVAVVQAGEDELQVPVGVGLGPPDVRQPGLRVGQEPLIFVLRAEALDEPMSQFAAGVDATCGPRQERLTSGI